MSILVQQHRLMRPAPSARIQRRVLHCIPTLGGGGAERQLGYLALELKQLGWEVHVAFCSAGANLDRLQAAGAVLHHLGGRTNYDPRLIWDLRQIIRQTRPDVVQTWLMQMDVCGGLASRGSGVPWIMSERCSAAAYPAQFKSWLRAQIGARAAMIVSNSGAGDAYWRGVLQRPVRRRVVPNAVPLETIAAARPAARESLGIAQSDKLLVHVGRLDEQKNVETLLAALALLPASPRVTAVLCGDGPLRSRLEQLAASHGIADRVRLTGYTSAAWSWLKAADVCVSASVFEGRPNVVLEAMACGCPLVASNIAEHREILDDQTAILVPPREPQAIAAAIARCLALPGEASARAARARATVADLSTAHVAHCYHELYLEVLNARLGGRDAFSPSLRKAA